MGAAYTQQGKSAGPWGSHAAIFAYVGLASLKTTKTLCPHERAPLLHVPHVYRPASFRDTSMMLRYASLSADQGLAWAFAHS